jgi:type II secretory pathway predicted ATPase ExeA
LENQFSLDLSKLHDNPLGRQAGTSYPFLSSSFCEALAALYYGLEYGDRILMLAADRGLGKSTLLRYFERRIQDRGCTLLISPNLEKNSDPMRELLARIGSTAASDDLLAMRQQVDEALMRVAEAESPFTLLLDYDENAAQSALETLRHLTSLESFERGLLRVVIAGSPDLAESLEGAVFAHEIRCVPLARLTPGEVESYIDYRLRLVGWRGSRLLTSKACSLIAEKSGARPSAINQICSSLLQNLAELNGSHSDSATRTENSILDEAYVDFVISGRRPTVATPTHPFHRRRAALACIVFVLVLAMAGVWYRSAIKARIAKPATADMRIPPGHSSHDAVLQDPRLQRSPDGAPPISGRTKAYDTASMRPTNALPPALLSSPITGAPFVTGEHPAAAVTKEQSVVSAPLSWFVKTGRTPTSSAEPQRITATHPAAARETMSEPGDSATSTADEMAAHEIRLGDAYMNAGDYDQALASFSRAIALAPDDREAEEKVRRARRAKTAEESVLQ